MNKGAPHTCVNKGTNEGMSGERGNERLERASNERLARELPARSGIRGSRLVNSSCSLLLMDESLDSSPLASLAHLHGRVYLVVSRVFFVERGDQVEEVFEDRGDGGRGKVGGCASTFRGAQSLEYGLHVF